MRDLGLEDCVVRPRFHHDPPTRRMLATALAAIVGAVWMDLGDIEEVIWVMYKVGLASDEMLD